MTLLDLLNASLRELSSNASFWKLVHVQTVFEVIGIKNLYLNQNQKRYYQSCLKGGGILLWKRNISKSRLKLSKSPLFGRSKGKNEIQRQKRKVAFVTFGGMLTTPVGGVWLFVIIFVCTLHPRIQTESQRKLISSLREFCSSCPLFV